MAAARHPCGAVHSLFHPDRPIPRRGPPAGRPRRAAPIHALQPAAGPWGGSLRHRHQPLSARLAGGGCLTSSQCVRLFRHLVGGSPLHHGHGDVHGHAPRHRRRADPRPHQRAGLYAGRPVQLFPDQPHPHPPPLRLPLHGLGVPGWGCRAQRWAPPFPPWWVGCWRWRSYYCGKARSASGSPARGRSPARVC